MDWTAVGVYVTLGLAVLGGLWKLASAVGENTAMTKQILANQTRHETQFAELDVTKIEHEERIIRLEEWRKVHDPNNNGAAVAHNRGRR